jgi:lysophospholipase L1-like esterase
LRDICEAIATVANSYGYQVLDLNQYFLDEMAAGLDMDTLFPDGLHPNESGNEKIALALEKLLLQ